MASFFSAGIAGTSTGQEVDIVLEAMNGNIVGIEVKSSHTVHSKDFIGLKTLQELIGDDFVRGIVLYTGDKIVSFGKNLMAIPISAIWEW